MGRVAGAVHASVGVNSALWFFVALAGDSDGYHQPSHTCIDAMLAEQSQLAWAPPISGAMQVRAGA